MNIVLFTRSFYILLTKIIIAIPLFIIAIMFMIRYKNIYFIAAKDRKQPYFIFTSYKKTKNGWKSFIQPPNLHTTKIKCKDRYKIHYLNNREDGVTGIFIESFQSENAKGGLNEKTSISDKYNTPFSYIKSKDGLPIKVVIEVEDFPIPFREKKIIKEYSHGYIYFGIVEHNITDDYYLKIDNEKFNLMSLKDMF